MLRKSIVLITVLSLTYASCKKESVSNTPQPPADTIIVTPPVVTPPVTTPAEVFNDNDNLLLGNPSNATQQDDNDYLLKKPAYDVSYSRSRGIPNWVSWHLYSADLGSVSRTDDFLPDGTLPANWYAVTSESYNGSGFDRGHDCPSGDRTISTTLNSYTFLMTNIIPQAPILNQGIWADLENYIRDLVTQGNEAYIIMGNYGVGGTGAYGYAATIDKGNVTVPATIWKVAVIIPDGNNDTSRINANTRVIAVEMPNTNAVTDDWRSYRTSVDAIETATGLNLLSRLPVSLQADIEAKVDNQ